MGCCFCCLNEAAKVGRVLDKFSPAPVREAQDGMLQKLVGRVVLAGTQPFYAPGSGRPCVWYRVTVSEERIRMREERNAETGEVRMIREEYWEQICKDERFMDFYLQDGTAKLFVNASNRGTCRIQGTSDSGRSSIFNEPPPGIRFLIAQRMSTWNGWGLLEGRTGRFRYTEQSFDCNELLAALGLVAPGMDPYTRQAVKLLTPFGADTLTEEFFTKNEWSDWDKRAWADLTKSPAVLLSDHAKFTGGVPVQPAVNLPVWMTQPGQMNAAMYAPGYGAPGAGGGVAPGASVSYQQGGYPQGGGGGYPQGGGGGYPQAGGYPQGGGYPQA